MPDPLPELSPAELARYSRHILLDELGVEGQRRLAAARVLVIGVGGLGSPAALYLAAAGIGTLGLADLDQVETHNLQRQLLYDTASVGAPKVAAAAARLRALNPHVRVVTHDAGITAANAVATFADYDVLIDGTDNFSARYLNNDAAFFARKPLVFGGIFKFEGQVSVFDPARGGPCYRCLFPTVPAPDSVPACGEAGVLGALCGVIGSLQALEAVKYVAGIGASLTGRLLTCDALRQEFHTHVFARDPHCPLCGPAPSIHSLIAPALPPETAGVAADHPLEISVADAKRRLETPACRALLVDVREPWETQICRVQGSTLIPMRQIPEHLPALPHDRHLLILCHHGVRSLHVTAYLRDRGFPAVSNVAGGIKAWSEQLDPAMARY